MFHAHGKDKGSPITRLEAWERITNKTGTVKIELTERPKMRDEAQYLWNMYCGILQGCKTITWVDVDAYHRLHKLDSKPWEISIIMDIEQVRLKAIKEDKSG